MVGKFSQIFSWQNWALDAKLLFIVVYLDLNKSRKSYKGIRKIYRFFLILLFTNYSLLSTLRGSIFITAINSQCPFHQKSVHIWHHDVHQPPPASFPGLHIHQPGHCWLRCGVGQWECGGHPAGGILEPQHGPHSYSESRLAHVFRRIEVKSMN